ncbi:toxin glutamine deamidase domain-containing protein [Chitinophaga fulva]|uniref:toxin glutamine deamidase domain-containing protein n=1 Tax=Chitinophaga fulva TaxID=2728842 RepID=UPI00374254F1
MENYFGRKFTYNLTIDQIKGRVGKPGDLGIVISIRGGGSAHVFNIYNNRGIIQFLDAQTGKVANLKDNYKVFGLLRTN